MKSAENIAYWAWDVSDYFIFLHLLECVVSVNREMII
jgi:hypothetical protein